MLGYVYGHDEIVAQFVAQMIPSCRERGFSANKAIGIVEDGKLIAGIVYHNYEPEAQVIEISGAALPGKYWLTRETLRRMFQYPFLTCGCQMVVQRVPAEDERQLYFLARFGYRFVEFPRMFGRDKDGVIARLTFEAWAANKICQKYKHHIANAEQLEEAA